MAGNTQWLGHGFPMKSYVEQFTNLINWSRARMEHEVCTKLNGTELPVPVALHGLYKASELN